MNKLDLNQTIGESVNKNPELVKVYMDYGVDFCCGGDRTVKEAIARDTKEVKELIIDAQKAMEETSLSVGKSDGKKLSDLSNEQLIDKILTDHHHYLKDELPVISKLMFKILMVHGSKHPELFEIHKLFGSLKTEIEGHLVKEEIFLFPGIKENTPNIEKLIEELEAEHDNAGEALHKITDLTNHFNLPEDACATYETVYRKLKILVSNMYMHVHSENNILFKRLS